MSEEKSNGHNVNTWPSSGQACKQFQTTQRQLIRWHQDGRLTREKGADGTYRYNPDEIADCLENTEGTDSSSVKGTEVLLGGGVDLLKQAHLHIEKMFAPASSASMALLTLLQNENARLAAQNEKLVEAHTSLVMAREEALNESGAREVAMREADASAKRKDVAVQLLKQALQSRIGGGGSEKLMTFLASLAPEQQARLSEVLTPEQLSMLQEAVA
jgi:hypothetical protein